MKICPLLKSYCEEEKCAWWNDYECAVKTIMEKLK